jgi:hypothetical protein
MRVTWGATKDRVEAYAVSVCPRNPLTVPCWPVLSWTGRFCRLLARTGIPISPAPASSVRFHRSPTEGAEIVGLPGPAFTPSATGKGRLAEHLLFNSHKRVWRSFPRLLAPSDFADYPHPNGTSAYNAITPGQDFWTITTPHREDAAEMSSREGALAPGFEDHLVCSDAL